MLNRFLPLVFASLFCIRSNAEKVPVLELPVDLKVNCEYTPAKNELVFLSNGNLRYLLPRDSKFSIKKYTSGADRKKMFFQLEYSEADLVWGDFDNSIKGEIRDFKDMNTSANDEVYLDVYISGEFKGDKVYGMIRARVRLNVRKVVGDKTDP